jgi:hypothetical protein
MKYLPLILLIINFAIIAEPTDCIQKSKENYKSEKDACGSLFGVEKSNCVETAKEKLRANNLDCKAKLVECISKANATKNDSKKSCSGKEAAERTSCIKMSEEEFIKSKYECRKM